ncbi:MAG TPA: acetyl-CoA carboxylase carboxyl transferase subunit beta [Coriobacteriia bacterium]|nr:acetyl-CoA carboxylase carboxyl transferase subunit beta [Coriobacteriia bacterium]
MSILDFFLERKATLEELAQKRSASRKAKGRIRIKGRINEVLDPRTSSPLFEDIVSADPLEFPGYAEKTADLAKRSGLSDAFSCAVGAIKGHQVVCAELIPDFLMGSMGTAVGEAICRSAEYARERKLPLVVFSASGGARMQEGMFSLMQMAKTSAAVRRLSDEGGLFISVLTHPTTGGVTASFAMLGDIILAEPNALIGFAGPRVIEQTIRATLPEGFQRSEFQQKHGFVDAIVPREQMRDTLAKLLNLHPCTRAVVGDVFSAKASGTVVSRGEFSTVEAGLTVAHDAS